MDINISICGAECLCLVIFFLHFPFSLLIKHLLLSSQMLRQIYSPNVPGSAEHSVQEGNRIGSVGFRNMTIPVTRVKLEGRWARITFGMEGS